MLFIGVREVANSR